MPKVTMIYGGPGTGKTHALLEELAIRLKDVPANQIAYVSYTRQGTYQGVDLAKEQFDLEYHFNTSPKDILKLSLRKNTSNVWLIRVLTAYGIRIEKFPQPLKSTSTL